MRIAVIGGGASGMLCSGYLAKFGHQVTLIEKNEKLGKKLFITGKGRCNITNDADRQALLDNIISNPKFAISALSKFTPKDTMNFFEEKGVPLKVERGNRVFPQSDKSSDIIKALEKWLYDMGVNVLLNTEVKAVNRANSGFDVLVKGTTISVDKVVVATGGISYPATGSTGDGYKWAKEFGHSITDLRPGLNALLCKNTEKLAGLTLKNVGANIYSQDKLLCSEFGEMLFTHHGVSGPIILSLCSRINKYYVKGKFNRQIELKIDLKPALSFEQLEARLIKDFKEKSNLDIKNLMPEYMPKALIEYVLNQAKISQSTKCNSITIQMRENLINALKGLKFNILDIDKIEAAIITSGGVDVKDISPKDMQSKLVPGLYFIGEVLDIDALTGGFNLQLALSSAYAMASSLENE